MKNRYKAFISYSHADEAWARWLHRKLEHYRLPRSVRNGEQVGGGDLRPIFRDRDELASSGSLSSVIRDALQRSDALIVICSPAAAKSKWVNQEILEFCRLQRADRVFCCIVEGDPPGVFPEALAVLDEPLAADFRKTGDGRRVGLTKLVAGMLGLGLDDLRQREAQARRRRQAVVTGASAMGMVITTGLAAWAWLAQQRAVEEAARATALNDFMTQMLTAADPATLGNRDVTVVEVLERASAAADETLRGQPEAEASARTLLGSTFNSLGKADAAVRELERALALRRRDPSPPDAEHASTLRALAYAYESRGDYENEVPLLEEAIAILEGLGDARLEELASAYRDLAQAETLRSRFTEAARALDRGDEALARMPSPQPKSLGEALIARGALAQRGQGDMARAAELYRAALVEIRKTGDRYLIANGLNNVAVAEMLLGHLDEAAVLMQEAIDIRTDLLGDGNPLVASSVENLANVRYRQRDYRQAAELLGRALSIRESVFGADSYPAAKTRFNTGVVTAKAGDFARAFELIDGALPVFRAHVGEKSQEVAGALNQRGKALEGLGDNARAMADYRAALAIVDGFGAPASQDRLLILDNMAALQCRTGSQDAGRQTLELGRTALDRDNPGHATWFETFEKRLESCSGG